LERVAEWRLVKLGQGGNMSARAVAGSRPVELAGHDQHGEAVVVKDW